MKLLLVIASLMMASNVFAGLDQKKVDRLTRQAKSQFNQFVKTNPSLAQMESKFVVKGGLQYFPGQSLMSFRYVCINGGNVQTTVPVNKCIQWSVDFEKNNKEWTQSFSSFHKAKMAEDDRYADSDAYCSAKSTPAIASHPISYQTKGCVVWAVDFEDKDGDEWTNTYNSLHKAKMAEDDRYADSKAYCAKRGTVTKTVATSQNLKVFRMRKGATEKIKLDEDDNDLYLGKWKYRVPSCNEMDLPPVPAN